MTLLRDLKQQALLILDHQLAKEGIETGGVHSKTHLTIVADLSQLIGRLYQFNERELFLAYFASLFHDIIRSPAQDHNLNDEELSAKIAVSLSQQFDLNDEEKKSLSYAIENHGRNPEWMLDDNTRNQPPKNLNEKLRFALFVADKIEQNGVRVIARRSAFIAERLEATGDLQSFGFTPGKDELLTLGLESIIRLTFINPQNIYPNKLQPLLDPLYKVHLDFTLGILKVVNLSVQQLAEILLNTKRPDGKSLLNIRKIEVTKKELIKFIEKDGQINDQKIRQVSNQTREAAVEAAQYFSLNYKQNLDKMMKEWKPETKVGKDWHRQMVEYLDGTWFNLVEKELL